MKDEHNCRKDRRGEHSTEAGRNHCLRNCLVRDLFRTDVKESIPQPIGNKMSTGEQIAAFKATHDTVGYDIYQGLDCVAKIRPIKNDRAFRLEFDGHALMIDSRSVLIFLESSRAMGERVLFWGCGGNCSEFAPRHIHRHLRGMTHGFCDDCHADFKTKIETEFFRKKGEHEVRT